MDCFLYWKWQKVRRGLGTRLDLHCGTGLIMTGTLRASAWVNGNFSSLLNFSLWKHRCQLIKWSAHQQKHGRTNGAHLSWKGIVIHCAQPIPDMHRQHTWTVSYTVQLQALPARERNIKRKGTAHTVQTGYTRRYVWGPSTCLMWIRPASWLHEIVVPISQSPKYCW